MKYGYSRSELVIVTRTFEWEIEGIEELLVQTARAQLLRSGFEESEVDKMAGEVEWHAHGRLSGCTVKLRVERTDNMEYPVEE